MLDAPPGLEGLAVTDTRIGDVLGQEGTFHYRGYDATRLAREVSFEDVWHLLLVGELPTAAQRRRFCEHVLAARARGMVSTPTGAPPGGDRIAALRTAWSDVASRLALRPWGDIPPEERVQQAITLTAVAPILIARTDRSDRTIDVAGLPIGTASAYLHLVTDVPPSADEVRALERYLVVTLDHGLNASTFTARTVASTGADLGAVVVAALGALSGPLHGGAPSRALEMLDQIGSEDRAEPWLRERLRRGERIMGFGHRVYRTEDPRARLLRETARELGSKRVDLALAVEATARRVLREERPDRVLDVNVEYWAAVVLDAVGVPPRLFTPTFALARSVGWMANALEQIERNRIIRPSARYVGPTPPRPLP